MVSDYASIVTAVATVFLALYAAVQVWLIRKQTELMNRELLETRMARDATIVLHVLEHMDRLRESWHQLYELPDDFKKWSETEKQLADRVGVGLQQVAYLAETNLFDRSYLADNYAGTFVNCWKKLEGYIRDYRLRCGEPETLEDGAFQRRHLEVFVQFAQEYLRKFNKVPLTDLK